MAASFLPVGWTEHELNSRRFWYHAASNTITKEPPFRESSRPHEETSDDAPSSTHSHMNKDIDLSFAEVMKTMWRGQKFTDMVIVAEDEVEFPCHRAVLAASSPVLDAMLTNNMKEGSRARVDFKVDANTTEALLQHIYGLPFTSIEIDVAVSLLQLADMYHIPRLLQQCCDVLCRKTCEHSIVKVLQCFGQFCHVDPVVQASFVSVEKRVKSEPALLRAVCMYPASPKRDISDSPLSQESCTDPMKVPSEETLGEGISSEQNPIVVESDLFAEQPDWNQMGLAHFEAPAQVDEEEAALLEQARWVSMVEARIASSCAAGQNGAGAIPELVRIKVLHFQRHPRELAAALLNSSMGAELMALGATLQPDWANGAIVMVVGVSSLTMERIDMPPSVLRPWHVVIKESDEPRLLEALNAIPCRARPRIRVRQSKTFTVLVEPIEGEVDLECHSNVTSVVDGEHDGTDIELIEEDFAGMNISG